MIVYSNIYPYTYIVQDVNSKTLSLRHSIRLQTLPIQIGCIDALRTCGTTKTKAIQLEPVMIKAFMNALVKYIQWTLQGGLMKVLQ